MLSKLTVALLERTVEMTVASCLPRQEQAAIPEDQEVSQQDAGVSVETFVVGQEVVVACGEVGL